LAPGFRFGCRHLPVGDLSPREVRHLPDTLAQTFLSAVSRVFQPAGAKHLLSSAAPSASAALPTGMSAIRQTRMSALRCRRYAAVDPQRVARKFVTSPDLTAPSRKPEFDCFRGRNPY
jgi:hypothetical protein